MLQIRFRSPGKAEGRNRGLHVGSRAETSSAPACASLTRAT